MTDPGLSRVAHSGSAARVSDGPRGIGLPGPRGKPTTTTEGAPGRAEVPPTAARPDFRPDPDRMERASTVRRAPEARPDLDVQTCHNPAEVRLHEGASRRLALLDPPALALLKRACRCLSPKGWPRLVERFLKTLDHCLHHRARRWAERDRHLPADWSHAPWYRLEADRFAAPDPPRQANLRSAARGLVYLSDLGFRNLRLARSAPPGPGLTELISRGHRLGLRVVVALDAVTEGDVLAPLEPLSRALHDGALGFVLMVGAAPGPAYLQDQLTVFKLFAAAVSPAAAVFVEDGRPDLAARWVGGAFASGSTGADFVPWPGFVEAPPARAPRLLHGARLELRVAATADDPRPLLTRAFAAPGTPVIETGAELCAPVGRLGMDRLARAGAAGPDTPVGALRDLLRAAS